MLNFGVCKDSIEKLQKAVQQHEALRCEIQSLSAALLELRRYTASTIIQKVESYVNCLAHSPKKFDKSVADFRVAAQHFGEAVQQFEMAAMTANRVGSSVGAAGTMAGVGVAAFGPTVAMAIATTFGTASTGTAISALTGAAATNAALAWLGGGALAAGGGGMAAGDALLALAGPVGWTIGGVALVGSGIFLSHRNGKIAEEATNKRIEVEKEIHWLATAKNEIIRISELTQKHSAGCETEIAWLEANASLDYHDFTQLHKERLGTLINHINALGKLLTSQASL